MGTKFYATRSAVQAPNSEFDAAMQHEQIGPFSTETETRNALAHYFVTGVRCQHPGISHSVAELFIDQFLNLLAAMASDPVGTVFEEEADGVRWTIHAA